VEGEREKASAGPILVDGTVDPLIGETLVNRYWIERQLGQGGMGTVYLARHLVLDKEVALKVLHAELARKPELRERFLNEAKAASRIRHENVIDITDFGTAPGGQVFFAMELLSGRDLLEEMHAAASAGGRLPWKRSRAIFLQVCSALSAAHKAGILHRDLKPENIYLVEWLGHVDFVKLLDFGIAKSTEVPEDGRKLTRTGMLFGTPEYMSPEQARGEKPDRRVDVYAMGCILFQLISNRVPFEADSFMGVLSRHLADPVPLLGAALAEVGAPAELDAVVQTAMAKDRQARYPSIDALAEAVRSADEAGRTRRSSQVAPIAGAAAGAPQTGPVLAQRPGAAGQKVFWVLLALMVLGSVGFALLVMGGNDQGGAPQGNTGGGGAAADADLVEAGEGPGAGSGPAVTAPGESVRGELDARGELGARDAPSEIDPPGPGRPGTSARDDGRSRRPRSKSEKPKSAATAPEPQEAEPQPHRDDDEPTPGDVKTKDPFKRP
jgi:serine/threonine-protein kinase